MPEARLRKARQLYPELNNPHNPAAVFLAHIAEVNRYYDAHWLLSEQPDADLPEPTTETPWAV